MPPVFSAVDEEGVQDLTCVICLEPWQDPIQLEPCQHIFCRKCLKLGGAEGSTTGVQPPPRCPMCRGAPAKVSIPNRILVNMAKEAKMKCSTCGWIGTNEDKKNHRTCGSTSGGVSPTNNNNVNNISPRLNNNSNNNVSPFIMNANPQQVSFVPRADGFPSQLQQQQYVFQQQGGAAPWNANGATASFPPTMNANNNNNNNNNPNRPFVNVNPGPWDEFGLEQFVYDHIMTVFMTFDDDDSGFLDRRELERMARYLNFAHSKEDIDKMFREMDTRGRGQLDMHGFCTWLSRNRPDPQRLYGLSEIEYHDALFQFHEFDRDNSGLLDKEEFSRLALRMKYANDPADATRLFDRIDIDKSGQIDLHEMLSFLKMRKYQGRPPISPTLSPQQPQMQQQQQQQMPPQMMFFQQQQQQQPIVPPQQQRQPSPQLLQQQQNQYPGAQNYYNPPPQQQQQQGSPFFLQNNNANFNNSFNNNNNSGSGTFTTMNGSGSGSYGGPAPVNIPAPTFIPVTDNNNMNVNNNNNINNFAYPPLPGAAPNNTAGFPQASDYYNNNSNNNNNNNNRNNNTNNNRTAAKKEDCVIQ